MTLDNKMQASADARNVFADIIQQADNKTVFLLLVILTASTSIGSAFMNVTGADSSWWSGWLQNFSTEMMGAIATFLLFEGIISPLVFLAAILTWYLWILAFIVVFIWFFWFGIYHLFRNSENT